MFCTTVFIPAIKANAIKVAGMSLGESVTGLPFQPLCTHSVVKALWP